jgi:hypothetical protein
LTQGTVEELNVTVDVCYETLGFFRCKKLARFVDQIAISPGSFSAGGDSGSLIVTQEGNKPVGLLFAGSSIRTFANLIGPVLTRFNVTIDDGSGTVTSGPVTDIAVTGLTSPTSVTQGESVIITATLENVGNQDVTDDIPLTLTISNNSGYSMIDGNKKIEGGLNAGGSTIITYTWDTSDHFAPSGDYIIQVAHSYEDANSNNDSLETSINVKDASVEEPSNLTITTIDPNSIKAGSSVDVSITGSGFQSGVKVAFENGAGPAPTASITDVSGSEIKATVTARSGGPKTNRVWDVRVTNPDGQSVVLNRGFTVTP